AELHCGPDDRARLAELRALARSAGLPLVATGGVHMHVRSRRRLQDVLTAVRLRRPVRECGHALFPNAERSLRLRMRLRRARPSPPPPPPLARPHTAHPPSAERRLRLRMRLAQLYPPELLAETLRVAERCAFSLDELRYEYPEE